MSEIATGRWPYVLAALGASEKAINGKHQACPFCGGKDRFRFTDYQGRGAWVCNHCCPPGSKDGDGFGFLMRLHGWGFKEAVKQVESVVGVAPIETPTQIDEAKIRSRLMSVWSEGEELTPESAAGKYLLNRVGYIPQTMALRSHPGLEYRHDDGRVEYFQAMIAAVMLGNKLVSIHRTYLTDDGQKANVPAVKKLMQGLGISGASIAIGYCEEVLGVAEGIETALACSVKSCIPVWPAISAGGMESFVWPDKVKKLVIFGDNDKSFTGHAAAYALAKRAVSKGLEVDVHIPKKIGHDWLDIIGKKA